MAFLASFVNFMAGAAFEYARQVELPPRHLVSAPVGLGFDATTYPTTLSDILYLLASPPSHPAHQPTPKNSFRDKLFHKLRSLEHSHHLISMSQNCFCTARPCRQGGGCESWYACYTKRSQSFRGMDAILEYEVSAGEEFSAGWMETPRRVSRLGMPARPLSNDLGPKPKVLELPSRRDPAHKGHEWGEWGDESATKTGVAWECLADDGWKRYDGSTEEVLERVFERDIGAPGVDGQTRYNKTAGGKMPETTFRSRFQIRGNFGRIVWSNLTRYTVDWDTFEQINEQKVRRKIRRCEDGWRDAPPYTKAPTLSAEASTDLGMSPGGAAAGANVNALDAANAADIAAADANAEEESKLESPPPDDAGALASTPSDGSDHAAATPAESKRAGRERNSFQSLLSIVAGTSEPNSPVAASDSAKMVPLRSVSRLGKSRSLAENPAV